jgi:transcriptional regulator with XRE-family HTH domain
MRDNVQPYLPLGNTLKLIREHMRETVAEVSGAVEIDERTLERIEGGRELPSEDILLLLISHFGVQDDKAAELWKLAGYDKARDDDTARAAKNTMMIMIDPRVMYSDNIEVIANPQGVVLNFSQNSPQSQPLTVARIGMSREQAKLVMGVLHQALYELDNPTKPKQLPSSLKKREKNN